MDDLHLLHLHKALQISGAVLQNFTATQTEIDRFAFVGIDKVRKITLSLVNQYPLLQTLPDIEFSMGILLRSLMMDDLMVLGLINKAALYAQSGNDKDELKAIISDQCYIFLSDGTGHLIEQAINNEGFTPEQRIETAKRFALTFFKAFNIPENNSQPPKLKNDYKLSLKGIYKEISESNLTRGEQVYDLYNFYSKYDHLSHWTGQATHIPYERRKHRIDFGIVIILMHLRDLIALTVDLGNNNNEVLMPLLTNLDEYLRSSYNTTPDVTD